MWSIYRSQQLLLRLLWQLPLICKAWIMHFVMQQLFVSLLPLTCKDPRKKCNLFVDYSDHNCAYIRGRSPLMHTLLGANAFFSIRHGSFVVAYIGTFSLVCGCLFCCLQKCIRWFFLCMVHRPTFSILDSSNLNTTTWPAFHTLCCKIKYIKSK